MENTVQKIFKILTRKDKKNFIFSLILLQFKSVIEVLGIGLIIPILHFMTNHQDLNYIFKYLPFLESYRREQLIFFFIAVFISVYLLKTLYVIFYNIWINKFTNNLSVGLTQRVLKQYLEKDYIFFLENNSAYLIRNISSETGLFAMGLVGNIITCFTQIVFIVSTCTFLILYNIYSLYVVIILVILSSILVLINNNKFKKYGEIRLQESASFLKRVHEVIGSIKEVILYDKKSLSLNEVHNHGKKFAEANIFRDVVLSFTAPIIEFVGIFIFFGFFLFLLNYSTITLEEIVVLFGVFAFASLKLLPATTSLIRSVQGIKFNRPACDTIYKILEGENNINKTQNLRNEKLSEINTLNFEDIYFSYKNHEKLVLKGLNFQLKKGEKIAIVGETGSGKTTLLNLISSLLYPKSGKIIINKQKELDYSSNIRKNIGYVSQSVYLSDNSILFNITFQNKISSKEMRDLTSVLESLNLNKINNQPINLESPIGERGAKLSGGQIQRVGIARALFRDPSIMILDEATNALDNETEKKILDYIFKKLDNKIIILCTHKKELIKYCDKIIEVKNNEINITSNINNKK